MYFGQTEAINKATKGRGESVVMMRMMMRMMMKLSIATTLNLSSNSTTVNNDLLSQ